LKVQRVFLDALRCPFTGSRFEIEAVAAERDGRTLSYGVARSEAGAFPVISGVLRLLSDDLRAPLVDLVQRGRYQQALRGALEVPAMMGGSGVADLLWSRIAQRLKLDAATRTTSPAKQRLYNVITQPDVGFVDLAARAPAGSWTKWQTHRFSMPTFLPVYPLAHLARGRQRVLDFGCGLGHSAFLMTRLHPSAEVVCADYSFTSMFLAKRFLVPDAECICLDGDYPLPFDAGWFDCVFSTDALQYIETKIGLAREFQRVLSADGMIALAHLHNRLSPVKAGQSLTARAYEGLFDGMFRRLYPEEAVVADYITSGTLDLSRRWTTEELDQALGGLSLVAARSDAAFTVYGGLLDTYINSMRNPVLNPAYSVTGSNGRISVERRVGPPYTAERTIAGCEMLPKKMEIGISPLDSAHLLAARDSERDALRELVRRLVVVDVPDGYV
jgi:SAM-dependent methyltransferase